MPGTRERWTRRDFLRGAATVALVGAGASVALGDKGGAPVIGLEKPPAGANPSADRSGAVSTAPGRARVVLVRNKDVLDGSRRPKPEVAARLLDEGVAALLGESRAEAAWARLVKPDDTVGIKSNAWRFLPTPPEIEEAIRRRVAGAGVAGDRIGTDDRGVLENPVFARTTALINVRPMRTHHWAGVGSCIKNYIMFSPDPPSWHDDACANLAGLWDLPPVKGKTRLNILVMLTPLFHGKGPHHFQPRYTWDYRGLIVGTDPVAVDATGLRILEAKRRDYFGKDQPFATPPRHIRAAEERFHLGVADPARIDVVRIGWMDGALI